MADDAVPMQDLELFHRAVGPVKRHHHDRVEPSRRGPEPLPRSTQADEAQVLQDMVSDYFEPAELDTGEELIYCREGLQHGVLRKLRRGQFRVSAVLDLHGLTVTAARQALGAFIHAARRQDKTCVRVIHGKGNRSRHKGPVLKTKVNHWLRQRDDVLAFCSARPMDGGTGAIYLLLRRRA
ncbi:MAG: Smr/MutS family endonuclease [Pseudomonadota bacterium]|nr:Smr/MutS family endonuclease [Pseudomonadota bacterium]